jgi:tetratricopeptide (TPR) repeat protein
MEMMKFFAAMMLALVMQAQNFSEIQKAFSSSYSYESVGKYESAIEELKKVYDNNSYEMNLRLGWLSYLAGKQNEAISYYQNAMKLRPLSVEAKLGYVLPLAVLGRWDEVIKTYENILKIDPGNSTVLYRLGLIYYNKQDYKKAYTYFEKLVNLYPFSYDGLIMFAWTNYMLGKYSEARILFEKVLLLNPNDNSASSGLEKIK